MKIFNIIIISVLILAGIFFLLEKEDQPHRFYMTDGMDLVSGERLEAVFSPGRVDDLDSVYGPSGSKEWIYLELDGSLRLTDRLRCAWSGPEFWKKKDSR